MRDKTRFEQIILPEGRFRSVLRTRLKGTKACQQVKYGSTPHVERNWTIKLEHDDLSLKPLGRQRPLMNSYLHPSLLILKVALPAVSGTKCVFRPKFAVSLLNSRGLPLKLGVLSICVLQFDNLLVDFALCSFFYLRPEVLKAHGSSVITDRESVCSDFLGKHRQAVM